MIPDQLILIDPQGNFITASPKNVKKILKKEAPELAAKFDAESEQREKRKEYIIKLNEYLLSKK